MANPRPSIPSFQSIRDDTIGPEGKGTEYWLNVLNNEEGPDAEEASDPDFDTDESSEIPSLSTTSSSKPDRPRTLRAGYDRKNQRLVVVFRDGTWYEYIGVSEDMWQDFQASQSKSPLLDSAEYTGLERGAISPNSLSKSRRVQMTSLKKFSQRMYKN